MGRVKGTPKTGGRQKGVANKITGMNKAVITGLLSEYSDSGQMGLDFMALDARDRIMVAEKFMQYVMPKCQSVAIDLNAENKNITIEHRLAELSMKQDEENAAKAQ